MYFIGMMQALIGWMPIGLQLAFFGLCAFSVLILILKVIAFILDVIPLL